MDNLFPQYTPWIFSFHVINRVFNLFVKRQLLHTNVNIEEFKVLYSLPEILFQLVIMFIWCDIIVLLKFFLLRESIYFLNSTLLIFSTYSSIFTLITIVICSLFQTPFTWDTTLCLFFKFLFSQLLHLMWSNIIPQ